MSEQRDAQKVICLQTVLQTLLRKALIFVVKPEVHDVRVFPFAQQILLKGDLVVGGTANYGDNAVLIQQKVVRNCLGFFELFAEFSFRVLAELQ